MKTTPRFLSPRLIVGGVATVLLLAAVAPDMRGQKPAGPEKEAVVGKLVFVQGKGDAATMENVQIKQVGDHFFVVGRVVHDDAFAKNRFVGATLWLPLSDVARMIAFENLDQIKAALKPTPE